MLCVCVCVTDSGGMAVVPASEPYQLPGPPQKPVVTDVTRNSVTLTWQPNAHEGGAAVTSYIIEAFRYESTVYCSSSLIHVHARTPLYTDE